MTADQNLQLLRAIVSARTQARRHFEDRLRESRRDSLQFRRRICRTELVGQIITAALLAPAAISTHGIPAACFAFAIGLWGHMAYMSRRRMKTIDRDLEELRVAN